MRGRTYALNAPGRVDAESEKARFQSYWTTSLKMASLLTDTPKPLCECGLAGAAGARRMERGDLRFFLVAVLLLRDKYADTSPFGLIVSL